MSLNNKLVLREETTLRESMFAALPLEVGHRHKTIVITLPEFARAQLLLEIATTVG